MPDSKGFTLIEIIVVTVILGILAAVALPNYITMITQQAAQAAQNNLITIYRAQKNFYFSNGYYCTTSTQNTTCADTLAHLNLSTNLNLNITDTYFTYSCTDPNSGSDGNNGSAFSCTATNISNTSFTLTVVGSSQLILPGGTGCTGPTTWGTPCNPSCTDVANPSYCPSSSV